MTVRFTSGGVLKVPTPGGNSAWGVMLEQRPYIAFYRADALDLENRELQGEPIFIVAVYRASYSRGRWGEILVRIPLKSLPHRPPVFRQDIINPSDCTIEYPDGNSKSASPGDCVSLEADAVWDDEHIESRIDDFYANHPNIFAEDLKVKLFQLFTRPARFQGAAPMPFSLLMG